MIAKLTTAATLATQAASLLMAPPAFAAARACHQPVLIEADAPLRARWPELPAAIRGALDGREDVDTCARITVRLDHAAIILGVSLLDGRRASRAVSRTEDVVPTLVALLLMPELSSPSSSAAEVDAPATGAPTAAAPVATAAAPVATAATPETTARPPVVTTSATVASSVAELGPRGGRTLRFEFSLAAGARAGDGQSGVAFAALTSLVLGSWLLGLQGAAAQYRRSDDGEGSASLLLAILGGRHIRFDAPALPSIDLAAGPALALRGPGNRSVVRAQDGLPDNQMPPTPDDGPWVRLVAMARVNFRARALVRPFAGVDGELALGTWAAVPAGADPRPPAWTLGLVLGAAVGTP